MQPLELRLIQASLCGTTGDASTAASGPNGRLLQHILAGEYVAVLEDEAVQALLGAHGQTDLTGPSEYYAWAQATVRAVAAEAVADGVDTHMATLMLGAVACLHVFLQVLEEPLEQFCLTLSLTLPLILPLIVVASHSHSFSHPSGQPHRADARGAGAVAAAALCAPPRLRCRQQRRRQHRVARHRHRDPARALGRRGAPARRRGDGRVGGWWSLAVGWHN
jgi:hypothetical protein